jgi:type IV secretory pathway VirB10-like protein
VNRLAGVVAVAVLAASASGCARLFARSLGPPLGMPAPPARVVPIESQPIVAAPTVDDVPSRAPEPIAPTPPAPPPARVDRSEPAPPARTEAPADAGAAAAPAPVPTPPPPTLQTTANPTEAEQRARAALENARRDLGRIDVRRLSTDARAQYDIARRFVQQAEDALKNRNPVFAEPLADKAAQIAALLQRK